MDSLSQLLRLLAPEGTVDLLCRFAGNWQTDHPAMPPGHLPYHAILKGELRLALGETHWRIGPGDVVLLTHGTAHRLRGLTDDGPPAQAHTRHNGVLTEASNDEPGAALEMLCGSFDVGPAGALLLGQAPPLLRVRTAERQDCAGLSELLRMILRESAVPQSGSAAIVGDLSTTLLTLILRAILAEQQAEPGLLQLLTEPRLAPAVAGVLAAPAEAWTVESLAARCHLSRATFARHFARAYPLPPLEWIAQVRMARAATLLRRQRDGILRIAEECGYSSQAAFSRLFKRHFGLAPGEFRQRQRAAD